MRRTPTLVGTPIIVTSKVRPFIKARAASRSIRDGTGASDRRSPGTPGASSSAVGALTQMALMAVRSRGERHGTANVRVAESRPRRVRGDVIHPEAWSTEPALVALRRVRAPRTPFGGDRAARSRDRVTPGKHRGIELAALDLADRRGRRNVHLDGDGIEWSRSRPVVVGVLQENDEPFADGIGEVIGAGSADGRIGVQPAPQRGVPGRDRAGEGNASRWRMSGAGASSVIVSWSPAATNPVTWSIVPARYSFAPTMSP